MRTPWVVAALQFDQKGMKTKPHVIPYCRFTELIICYLGRTHNIHQRYASLFHLDEEDHRLGNLKFVPKGEEDEVFGMQIPKELITDNIRNASYYNAYLEMVAKHNRKATAEEGGKKKSAAKAYQSKKPATSKKLKPVPSKQSKPAPAKQSKPIKEKSTKPTPLQKVDKGKVRKVQNVKSSLQIVDEPNEEQAQPKPEPEPQGEQVDYDLQRGKGKSIATNEHVAQLLLELKTPKKTSTTDHYIFQRRIPMTEEASTRPSALPKDDTSANIIRDTLSPTNAETCAETDKTNSGGDTEILNVGEEKGEDVATKVDLEERTAKIDEGQAGLDPGKTPESRPPLERNLIEEDHARPDPGQGHVALAGPDPGPMHEDFIATVYPQVYESLKHIDEEHVHLENLLSSTGTLSSMKNLDNFNFASHLLKIKPKPDWLKTVLEEKKTRNTRTDDMSYFRKNCTNAFGTSYKDPEENKLLPKTGDMSSFIKWYCRHIGKSKLNKGDLKEGHWVVPGMSKPLPLGGPLGQETEVHKFSDGALIRILEKLDHMVKDFKLFKYNPGMDKRIWSEDDRRRSKEFIEVIKRRLKIRRIFRSLESFMSGRTRQVVELALKMKQVDVFKVIRVQILEIGFRDLIFIIISPSDLFKAEMKEIHHQQMFKSGIYQLQPKHVAIYEALEASMERNNRDEFLAEKEKSGKRRRDDQDPPPSPPNSNQRKKTRYNSNASACHQPQAQMPSAWKTTDTRDVPSSTSKKMTAS
nr:histone deacetylase 14 [Tanacetum cinerariifolium]